MPEAFGGSCCPAEDKKWKSEPADDAVCALVPPGSVKVVITLALGDLLVPVRAGSLAEHEQTFERRHPEGCLKCLEISPALPDHLCMVPVTNYNHC